MVGYFRNLWAIVENDELLYKMVGYCRKWGLFREKVGYCRKKWSIVGIGGLL